MTWFAITLPLDRVSPTRIPIRDMALGGTDSVTLSVTVVESDDPASPPIRPRRHWRPQCVLAVRLVGCVAPGIRLGRLARLWLGLAWRRRRRTRHGAVVGHRHGPGRGFWHVRHRHSRRHDGRLAEALPLGHLLRCRWRRRGRTARRGAHPRPSDGSRARDRAGDHADRSAAEPGLLDNPGGTPIFIDGAPPA